MSLFFMPIPGNSQLKEMWGRCDLCFRSDPFPYFQFMRRGHDKELVLCDACVTRERQVGTLVAQGWRWP